MPGDILDNQTRAFLASEAASIGFVGQHHQRYDIVEQCGSVDEWITQVATHDIHGATATVYELPESAAEKLGLDDSVVMPLPGATDGCGGERPDVDPDRMVATEQLFAVECNTTVDHDNLTFPADTTLLFNRICTTEEIEQALTLQSLEHRFRFGDLSPRYDCQHCGRTVHWLAVPSQRPLDNVTVLERERLLEHRSCGCELPAPLTVDG